jgi:hypothetical protein
VNRSITENQSVNGHQFDRETGHSATIRTLSTNPSSDPVIVDGLPLSPQAFHPDTTHTEATQATRTLAVSWLASSHRRHQMRRGFRMELPSYVVPRRTDCAKSTRGLRNLTQDVPKYPTYQRTYRSSDSDAFSRCCGVAENAVVAARADETDRIFQKFKFVSYTTYLRHPLRPNFPPTNRVTIRDDGIIEPASLVICGIVFLSENEGSYLMLTKK